MSLTRGLLAQARPRASGKHSGARAPTLLAHLQHHRPLSWPSEHLHPWTWQLGFSSMQELIQHLPPWLLPDQPKSPPLYQVVPALWELPEASRRSVEKAGARPTFLSQGQNFMSPINQGIHFFPLPDQGLSHQGRGCPFEYIKPKKKYF